MTDGIKKLKEEIRAQSEAFDKLWKDECCSHSYDAGKRAFSEGVVWAGDRDHKKLIELQQEIKDAMVFAIGDNLDIHEYVECLKMLKKIYKKLSGEYENFKT